MAVVEVKCGECGFPQQLDEAILGTKVKCPKCKEMFYAETGDAYGLADESADDVVDHRSSASIDGPAPSRPSPAHKPDVHKTTAHKPDAKPRRETKEERAMRERMEKWAEKMEE